MNQQPVKLPTLEEFALYLTLKNIAFTLENGQLTVTQNPNRSLVEIYEQIPEGITFINIPYLTIVIPFLPASTKFVNIGSLSLQVPVITPGVVFRGKLPALKLSAGLRIIPADFAAQFNPPVVEDLDLKIYSLIDEPYYNLDMDSWHECSTTHCRGGWAVVLAGPAGWALQEQVGTHAAAALIYTTSRPGELLPDFFADKREVLRDISACARRSDKYKTFLTPANLPSLIDDYTEAVEGTRHEL